MKYAFCFVVVGVNSNITLVGGKVKIVREIKIRFSALFFKMQKDRNR